MNKRAIIISVLSGVVGFAIGTYVGRYMATRETDRDDAPDISSVKPDGRLKFESVVRSSDEIAERYKNLVEKIQDTNKKLAGYTNEEIKNELGVNEAEVRPINIDFNVDELKRNWKPDLEEVMSKSFPKDEIDPNDYEDIMDTYNGYRYMSPVPVAIEPDEFGEDEAYDLITLTYHPEGPNSGKYLVNDLNGAVLSEDMIDEDLGGWDMIPDPDDWNDIGYYIRNDAQQVYYEILLGDIGYED